MFHVSHLPISHSSSLTICAKSRTTSLPWHLQSKGQLGLQSESNWEKIGSIHLWEEFKFSMIALFSCELILPWSYRPCHKWICLTVINTSFCSFWLFLTTVFEPIQHCACLRKSHISYRNLSVELSTLIDIFNSSCLHWAMLSQTDKASIYVGLEPSEFLLDLKLEYSEALGRCFGCDYGF